MGVEVSVERLGDALDVERGSGATSDGHRVEAGFLFIERDVEDLELLKERVAGLGTLILVGAGSERFALFAAHPHPGLAGVVAGDENDEMLEAGFGQFAVELEAGGVVGQTAARRFAEPGGEGIVGFPSAEGEFLASRLPAEFFDEELGQVALLQERVGEGEVRWHEII